MKSAAAVKKGHRRFGSGKGVYIFLSVVMGFLVGAAVLEFSGISPVDAYMVILRGTFGRPAYIMHTVVKATPLILTGLSVALAFRGGLFNIGAEGQFIIGATAAALAGYFFHLPALLHVPVVFLVAVAAAGLWGGLAGFLKARFGAHEVVSTIMLNWIALYLQNFVVMTAGFRKPDSEESYSILQSAGIGLLDQWKYSEQGRAWLDGHPVLHDLLRAQVNFGIVFAVACAFAVRFALKRTTAGYGMRAIGLNRYAAEYAGINVKRGIILSMFAAGSIAGAAGAVHVMGVSKNISVLASMEGYGFDGIAVALIANADALGCILSALLLGALKYGGSKIQPALGAPSEIIMIITGAVVFFTAVPQLVQVALSVRGARGKKSDA